MHKGSHSAKFVRGQANWQCVSACLEALLWQVLSREHLKKMYVSSVCFCGLLIIGKWRQSRSDRPHLGHHRLFCRHRIGAISGDHLSIGAETSMYRGR